MFLKYDKKCRLIRDARGSSRHAYIIIALSTFVLMAVAGCPAVNPFAALLPSEADVEAFNQQVASIPSMSIRIINETSASVNVELQAGVTPLDDLFFSVPFPGEELFLQSVGFKTVVVTSNGTLTGSIKCGEVIGVSVTAPSDQPPLHFGEGAFGLFIGSGNVALTGIGTADDGDFTGDLVTTARFVRPEEDGIDCEVDILTIRIETLATRPVYDDVTGVLLVPATLGTGTLSVD